MKDNSFDIGYSFNDKRQKLLHKIKKKVIFKQQGQKKKKKTANKNK